jgi:hypothetical protein
MLLSSLDKSDGLLLKHELDHSMLMSSLGKSYGLLIEGSMI